MKDPGLRTSGVPAGTGRVTVGQTGAGSWGPEMTVRAGPLPRGRESVPSAVHVKCKEDAERDLVKPFERFTG